MILIVPPGKTPEEEIAYYQAMTNQDPIAIGIQAVSHIDEALRDLILACVSYPAAIDKVQFEFSKKCALAVALGLDIRFLAPLQRLGKIRNDIAHKTGATISALDVKTLSSTLAGQEKDLIRRLWLMTLGKRQELDGTEDIDMLSPIDHFVLIAVTLRGIVVAERMRRARSM